MMCTAGANLGAHWSWPDWKQGDRKAVAIVTGQRRQSRGSSGGHRRTGPEPDDTEGLTLVGLGG